MITIAVLVALVSLTGTTDAGARHPTAIIDEGQAPAIPQPFPGSGRSPEPATVPQPPTAPAAEPIATRPASPTEPPPGLPVYPAAEFIDAFDAGLGQRYYLYGTNAPYADIVTYYKNLLKTGGRELYRVPPMQQFDLGRFDDESMVYPPSVVVKDYTWNNSAGYLAVSGTTEKRFKTIIQIVPVTAVR